MKDRLEKIYYECGCFAFIIGILLVLAIAFGWYCLCGWFIMLMWGWIAVPLGATALGYWVCVAIAFGLNLIGNLLFKRSSD